MFKKIVALEPLRVDPVFEDMLRGFAEEAVFYREMPQNDEETIRRIGDADCVLVCLSCPVGAEVLRACPNIRYIGMFCSLYSPQSANVDILEAEARGIVVKGVRDYGDPGVREYVVSELARFLHGFGGQMWREEPMEFTGLPMGVLGMGATGTIIAEALAHFGAEVCYYSRTRKPEVERRCGIEYLPLDDVLHRAQILITCLNRGTILLGEREFGIFGNGKILMNISIGPGHDVDALGRWLDEECTPRNHMFGDIPSGIDPSGALMEHPRVFCVGQHSGMTGRARQRLGEKAVANIEAFLREED